MKIYIILAEGFEMIEALTTVDVLRRANLDIVTMSCNDKLKVTSSHHVTIVADHIFDLDLLNDADVIILPGGSIGTENLGNNQLLLSVLKSHHAANKTLAAICAAPSILAKLGILENVKASSHPAYENELIRNGALYHAEETIVYENIITSYGMAGSLQFALAILKTLVEPEVVAEVKAGIVF